MTTHYDLTHPGLAKAQGSAVQEYLHLLAQCEERRPLSPEKEKEADHRLLALRGLMTDEERAYVEACTCSMTGT